MRRPIVTVKVLERIAKLQGLSRNNPEKTEAEAAARMALRLMREHCVSQREIDALEGLRRDPLVERVAYLDGLEMVDYDLRERHVYQVSGWKRLLASVVADYLGLRTSYRPGTAVFTVYGHASDAAACFELYGICARQIERSCRAYLRDQAVAHGARPPRRERQKTLLEEHVEATSRSFEEDAEPARRIRRWERWDAGAARTAGFSFKETAVAGLRSKFAELSRESDVEDHDGHALVLSRRAEVSSWVDANYTFEKGDGSGFGEATWCREGYEAGKRLELTEDRPEGISARKVRSLADRLGGGES